MPAIRDEEYAAVAERERPLLQATAYLLTGDPVQAERVVQRVLAELYGRWSKVTQPRHSRHADERDPGRSAGRRPRHEA